MVHADVRGHLRALKDYFLLAKGDFLQCFLEESRALMRLPPRPASAEEDLRVPWQQVSAFGASRDFCDLSKFVLSDHARYRCGRADTLFTGF